jgi:hypothetical protein
VPRFRVITGNSGVGATNQSTCEDGSLPLDGAARSSWKLRRGWRRQRGLARARIASPIRVGGRAFWVYRDP